VSECNHNQVRPNPREAPETTDFSNIPRDFGQYACIDVQGLSAPNPIQLAATARREVSKRTIDCVENASSGIAAGLTVDETRTVFAPWKPFSLSAVAPSIRRFEEAAPTLAAAPRRSCSPPPEKPSEITSLTADLGAAGPTAPSTKIGQD
jgi:hypothetical protein